MVRVEAEIGGRILSLETGSVAKQADGAVWVRYGDTVVLATVVASTTPRENIDFFPLSVEFQERMYATGKIPGGFFKREGRPNGKEVLSGRLIDRPLRPLFPKGYRNDVQVIVTVLSADNENTPDIMGIIGASAALYISDIPFTIPVGAVRMGMIDGKLIVNPSVKERDNGEMNVVACCSKDKTLMIEAEGNEITEDVMIQALLQGAEVSRRIITMQEELREKAGVQKNTFVSCEIAPELIARIRDFAIERLKLVVFISEKKEKNKAIEGIINDAIAHFGEEIKTTDIKTVVEKLQKEIVRKSILLDGKRADGRGLLDLREITCEVGVLPRTHGSAIFTRGQTQTIAVATLGTVEDEQIVDNIEGKTKKRFMLHYNFPPFSVGEASPLRGTGRREMGHGALAERSIAPVLPKAEEFPYTVRVVSDILESNGSTSMASVCGGTLALMDAGVPISTPVAGISVGLVEDGEKHALFTDITGMEDQYGDMDFKVAGTKKGITGIQVDIKVLGLSDEIVSKALFQAKQAREAILDIMEKTINKPSEEVSPYAPKIHILTIPVSKIRDLIGPGGKIIKGIIETTKAKINVSDDGTVVVSGPNHEAVNQALEAIACITAEVEVGKIYMGKVLRIMNFGAFVEVMPGREGLVHISQLSSERVNRVEDVVSEGDELLVKLMEIDNQGRLNFSHKAALQERK
ncbi:polyribonucleotide nucleotidyltransferase [Candidatus Desantisbacteria bacterium CG_4_8_14_3_um_filter_40_12]|uniref:Polyribonucleotide nucleotidyltransferase n=2 Tax=unclassified Candidatus Desantisiibacteriota TaxID=3106372 RepID=A0A2M7JB05_9BACT|nr:MAG: polyribonucleotide nucleotidyltransferase [Candidatus Desantisbacteria bacterium CG_4_8_14_3_um_filter_40_12]PIY18937.1 MAG: polyribonucleotide nucleotidyltransferase [Candidatus Desantisbacteria bacterium CG_4_10_14_3_um_filter_40_18]